MAFSQAGIDNVSVRADGPDLFVSWTFADPKAPTFQVYVDRRLAWYGTARRCHVPIPAGPTGRNVWVEVATVGPHEPTRDYAAMLVAPGGRSERARLAWSGGTYLDPTGRDDIQGFRVYQGPAPGVPVDFGRPVATVTAYPGGWVNDGFGKGGFGEGGFGRAATRYEWQSGPLASGAWSFAVVPCDHAGDDRGAGMAATITIAAAPRPPAADAQGVRLSATYSGPLDRRLTLRWLASPPPTTPTNP